MGSLTGVMGTIRNGVNLYFFAHLPSWIEERDGRRREGLGCFSAAQAKKMQRLPAVGNKKYTKLIFLLCFKIIMK